MSMTFDEFWAEFDPYKTKGQELFKGHNYQTGKMIWDAAEREALEDQAELLALVRELARALKGMLADTTVSERWPIAARVARATLAKAEEAWSP